jgi:hypothetical protein
MHIPRLLSVLVVISAALAAVQVSVSPAVAATALSLTATGTVTETTTTSLTGTKTALSFQGHFRRTDPSGRGRFAEFSTVTGLTAPAPCRAYTGTRTYTFHNGDELRTGVAGTWCPGSDGAVTATEHLTITGGSGRFSTARGSLTVMGVATPSALAGAKRTLTLTEKVSGTVMTGKGL